VGRSEVMAVNVPAASHVVDCIWLLNISK